MLPEYSSYATYKTWKKAENYVFVFILIKTKGDAHIFIIFQMSFQLRKFLVTYGSQDANFETT